MSSNPLQTSVERGLLDTVERQLDRLAALLTETSCTLSVAESCTGGLLGHLITSRPGSSAFFLGGVIAYSNESKVKMLGVSALALQSSGAVSEQVAAEMAIGVRTRFGSTLGVGITGIAGPDGGSPDKPVGLVFVSVATAVETAIKRNRFEGPRERIKFLSASVALDMVLCTVPQVRS